MFSNVRRQGVKAVSWNSFKWIQGCEHLKCVLNLYFHSHEDGLRKSLIANTLIKLPVKSSGNYPFKWLTGISEQKNNYIHKKFFYSKGIEGRDIITFLSYYFTELVKINLLLLNKCKGLGIYCMALVKGIVVSYSQWPVQGIISFLPKQLLLLWTKHELHSKKFLFIITIFFKIHLKCDLWP